MADAGFNVTHVYGLTETYGPAVVNEWHAAWDDLAGPQKAARKARQGVRYAALEDLDVMDPATMRPVPADGETLGEVMFRGNIVMKGYLKNPKATEEAFAGGWFHSGDLGVRHSDGYIQLKDRSKDIIISGGENISSVEVEGVLMGHPDVLLAAVVAKPDEKWGEVPCAFVELRDGAEATADDLARSVVAFRNGAPLRLGDVAEAKRRLEAAIPAAVTDAPLRRQFAFSLGEACDLGHGPLHEFLGSG